MPIVVEFQQDTAQINLVGGIDYSAQEEFSRANQQALSSEAMEILVNFAKATFLDSAGIRALILLQKEAQASGKSLTLIHCSEDMREIFEIGGFDRMFTFR